MAGGDDDESPAGPDTAGIKGNERPLMNTGVPTSCHSMPINCDHQSFSHVDATAFHVRGHNYLNDKIKIASKASAFELVEVSGFSSLGKCMFTTERADSYYARARKIGRKNFVFVMHFDLNPMHVVMVYELNSDALQTVRSLFFIFFLGYHQSARRIYYQAPPENATREKSQSALHL
jgi:hypothetical protein